MSRIGSLKAGLGRLLGLSLRTAPVTSPEVSPLPSTGRGAPVDSDCRPSDWLIREAFDRVMGGVLASEAALEKLYPAFQDSFRSDRAGSEETVLLSSLAGSNWRWPEFDRWAEIFARRGAWPAAWRKYPSLSGPLRQPPSRVSEAVSYFSYLEMRDILNAGPVARRPAPLRVEELSQAFLERVSWEEIAAVALEKYQGFVARCQAGREEALGRLLAFHLRAVVHNLIPYYQGLAIQENGLLRYRWELITVANDPILEEFAARFHAGGIEHLPPFFPGDESRLQLIRA